MGDTPQPEQVPTCGNCYTTYGGGWACKYVELCSGDLDGCSHPSEEAEEFSQNFDGTQDCPVFACDPAVMLTRAYEYIEQLEAERAAQWTFHAVVGDALNHPAAEGVDHEARVREAWNAAR